jgi:acetyltransferase-like isoleucine patch superfamily enzyme
VIDPAARVAASAEVDEAASIEPGADIGDRVIVRRGARVGAGTSVGRDGFVDVDVSIGREVRIDVGALIYRGAIVEDAAYIGPRAILANDRYPRVPHADSATEAIAAPPTGSIRLAHGSSVGAGAIVMAGCVVGRYATIGAGSVVTHGVPAHALVAGNPAHRIGWVCACGNRLNDAAGNPAPAEVERYASDPFLACGRCERRYIYVPDQDTLEERVGPAVGRAATPARS